MSEEQQSQQQQQEPSVASSNIDDELNQLNQYICEREERYQAKLALKTLNQQCASIGSQLRLDESVLKSLDSSIKRVTSFIKRLKTMTESQRDSLAKDLKQLNLSKYLSEVAAAFLEAKLKMNDVPSALHLCSLMHQSYAEFAPIMFEQWQKVLNLKKDEKLANASKLRVDLRFFAELITISVLPEKEALSLLGNQLTILTQYDKDYSNLAVITSFCKHCGEDFADLISLKYDRLAAKHNKQIPRNELYSAERQRAVRTLFRDYFKSLAQYILNEHKEVRRMERQNWKLYQTKGEVSADKKEKYEQALCNFRKLLENAEQFADLLGEQMPELPVDEMKKRDEDLINIDIYTPSKGGADEFDSTTSLWEDEDTRQFYECLPDLKSLIPGILYKSSGSEVKTETKEEKATPMISASESKSTIDETAVTGEEDMKIEMEKMERELQELENQQSSGANESSASGDLPPSSIATAPAEYEDKESDTVVAAAEAQSPVTLSTGSASTAISSSAMKILMDSFINLLPNCVNRELIDKAAKDFCLNLNTKANRRRLISALFQVQRTRLDLLPFYARFVATLHPIMPELSTELAQLLINDFRYHVRKKDQINIESKIKTVRFIGELVKFDMFTKVECLNCLKTLLADFRHHNIEMFCNLLDVCGRFLYRSPESHMKLKLLLEILMRKKQAAMSMDSRYTIMIENAFYYCNPPESKQSDAKKIRRSPMHEYIKKILYKDLNKLCVEKILRQMRKLNWLDNEIKTYSIKCLTAAWNVRYNSIHCLANLVSGLALYYEDVGIKIVDGVLEDIQVGMEINSQKFNQRRVSMIKYIGELYNYRMIGSSIIFKTFYSLILFGVVYDVNEAIAMNEISLDPVDNFFRIRLVCILLETCGQYFDRGSTKKKLDCFLLYFQRYYFLKRETSSKLISDILLQQHPAAAAAVTTLTTSNTSQSISNALQSSASLSTMSKPFDTIDIECVYTECIQALRPGFKFAQTYSEACERVAKMEEEIKETLTKSVPNFQQLMSSTTVNPGGDASAGLGTIREDDENGATENYPNEDEYEEDDEYGREDDDDRRGRDLDELDSRTAAETEGRSDSNIGSEVDEQPDVSLVKKQNQETSKEDEEFIKAFDSFVTENIAQRTKESVKMPTVDIQVPMISKKAKPVATTVNQETTSTLYKQLTGATGGPDNKSEATQEKEPNKTFNFVVMTKKGNRTQYHNLEMPVTCEFAQQFRAREEAEKMEKEKLKQLTLNINERMEQEELQEMIQSVTGQFYRSSGQASSSSMNSVGAAAGVAGGSIGGVSYSQNTNRDRQQKYIHPKGVPDVDLIFGNNFLRRQNQGGSK